MRNRKISQAMITQMAKRSLKANQTRNAFVIITILLATALLTVVLMFAAGQQKQTQRDLARAQQVGYYNLSVDQVNKLKEDERIAYQIDVKTGIPSTIEGIEIRPYYVSELSDQIYIAELESGRLPIAENEIAVPAAMLNRMKVGSGEGTQITLPFADGNTETFTVTGILKGNDTASRYAVFFSRDYADKGSQLKDKPYEVYAQLYGATTMSPDDCKEAMYLIGSDAGIERKNINPSKAFLDSLSIDLQDAILFGLVGMVILLACILVIYGVFYLSVIGRIRQFGQLRTIGMTKKQIRKFIYKEGRYLFYYGVSTGIILGIMAGYGLLPRGFSLVNTGIIVLCVLIVIYLITMISVKKPAKIAGAVSPIEALRYVEQDNMKKAECKKQCRKLTPLALGIMNFSKNKKKATITMLSLGLGGILFITSATYMTSFDQEQYSRQQYFKNAEFHIQYAESEIELNDKGMSGLQSEKPMDEALIQRIESIDGVKNITALKSFGIKFDFPVQNEFNNNDTIYPLTEEELKQIDTYLEEGSTDYDKLMSGDYILAAGNETIKEIYGWQFKPGDKVIIHYNSGQQMIQREVTIIGILNQQFTLDHNGLEGWFVMPEKAILDKLSNQNLNAHLLISTEPEKEQSVDEQLQKILLERSELSMETLSEKRAQNAQIISQIFGAISGLAIFIMLFSILSMINTLITNIVSRKQEIAMLESLGMSRKQIKKMLLGESLVLVLTTVGVTLSIGTLCGYLLCQTVYRMGAYYMVFQFPVAFVTAYSIVLIAVPLIITYLSMWYFSKETLVERLRKMTD